MSYFSPLNYFLLIASLVLHFPIGKKILREGGFFTCCMVGLCLSGGIIGILANFSAGMVRWYMYAFFIANISLFFYGTIKKSKQKPFQLPGLKEIEFKKIAFYLLLLGTGIFFFLANDPLTVFTEFDQEKKLTFLNFNSHYSYYSSISVELLNADYFSRLKLMNVYPYEWAQYHFFNSATQTAVQIFLGTPNLFTFFMAQTLILVFLILSVGEEILRRSENLKASAAIYIGWILIGFTLFSDTLTWNLATSGMMSVFALILFLISLQYGHRKSSFIFLAILSISAIRLFPVVAASISAYILWLVLRHVYNNKSLTLESIKHSLKKVAIPEYGFMLICLAYLVVTLGTGSPSGETNSEWQLIGSPFSKNGWQFSLITYRIIGFIYDSFFQMKDTYPYYGYGTFFTKINADPLFKYFFYALVVFMAILLIRKTKSILNSLPQVTTERFFLFLTILLLAYPFILSLFKIPSSDLLKFNTVFLPYALAIFVFSAIAFDGLNNDKAIIIFLLLFFTYATQHTGIIDSIKVPISFIFFDLMAWGLFLLYLIHESRKKLSYFSLSFILLGFLMILPNSFYSALALPPDYHTKKQDITNLVSRDFKREQYVDSNNFMHFDSGDEVTNDIYSSVLGARMNYNELYGKTDKILNYRFKPR